MRYFLPFVFVLALNAAPNIDPDVEVTIKGLVCSSCAIGLKNAFKKDSHVKGLKIDINKGTLSLEYWGIEIHPSKIKKMVKCTRVSKGKRTARIYHRRKCRKNERRI